MTQHDPTVRMRHILDHAKEAVGLLAGMRNRLVHGYDAVDLNVLWGTVQIDLPEKKIGKPVESVRKRPGLKERFLKRAEF